MDYHGLRPRNDVGVAVGAGGCWSCLVGRRSTPLSLRGAQRRGNPWALQSSPGGLPRFARNDVGGMVSLSVALFHSRIIPLKGCHPPPRHCEERSDAAIHGPRHSPPVLDCRASLAMTGSGLSVCALLISFCRSFSRPRPAAVWPVCADAFQRPSIPRRLPGSSVVAPP